MKWTSTIPCLVLLFNCAIAVPVPNTAAPDAPTIQARDPMIAKWCNWVYDKDENIKGQKKHVECDEHPPPGGGPGGFESGIDSPSAGADGVIGWNPTPGN